MRLKESGRRGLGLGLAAALAMALCGCGGSGERTQGAVQMIGL